MVPKLLQTSNMIQHDSWPELFAREAPSKSPKEVVLQTGAKANCVLNVWKILKKFLLWRPAQATHRNIEQLPGSFFIDE